MYELAIGADAANRRISRSSVGWIGSRTNRCAPLTGLPASHDLLGFRARAVDDYFLDEVVG
jgi:hypothetical protein